jgi:lysophospholipase L1-like esterase
MRKWTLVGGGLLAGLVLAEGVCRLVIPNPITGLPDSNRTSWRVEGLVTDPVVEFSFEPGYSGRMTLPDNYDVPFRINGQGLRADEEFAPDHPGRARILLVGDSFVFGIGVELQDTLGEQLERALDTDGQPGPPVEVVSVGVPSYGLDHYTKVVERWLPRLRPDLVVVALFPGNDLIDYGLSELDRRVAIEGRLVTERQAWSWGLRKYSVLAHMLLQHFNPVERVPHSRTLNPTPAEFLAIFQSIQPWMRRLLEAPGPGGPPVAVLVIESRHMLELHRKGRVDDVSPPLNQVLADLRELGCTVFDPAEAWVTADSPESRFFFPRDPHYTAEGNRFMAEWLAPRVREAFGARLLAAGRDAPSR